MAVEHKLPKKHHSQLERVWTNLLLACVNCNSSKGTRQSTAPAPLWPDEDNTFAAFEYRRSGRIRLRADLDENEGARGAKLLNLLGLDLEPMHSRSDHRWTDRLEVWRLADQCRQDLAHNDTPEMRHSIVKVATAHGCFSIWMAAFEGDIRMQQTINLAFPGSHPVVQG